MADVEIDGYSELERIGAGGFATVYRARQDRFDRTVAVKVLTVTLDEKAQRRFERECQATGRLSGHPGVVTVLDSGLTTDGRPFLATELLERGSLGDWTAQSGPLPVAEVLQIGVVMCGALSAVHAAGILHRDIKPENILVSAYGEPRLADFGISAVGMETTGSTLSFTPLHTPPEVLEGLAPAVTMDVYSLGSTLWTLAAGRPPFEHDDGEALMPFVRRLLSEPVPELPDGPECLDGALRRAMAKSPDDRFPDAASFGRALQECQRRLGHPVTELVVDHAGPADEPFSALRLRPPTVSAPPPPAGPVRRSRRAWSAAAVLAVVALVGAAAVVARDGGGASGSNGSDGDGERPATRPDTGAAPALVITDPVRGGRLVVGLPGSVTNLNPTQLGFTYANQAVAGAIVEPLTTVRGDEIVPYLARSVTANEDATVWTIELPTGVTFHDGSALDADAVVANLERFAANPLAAAVLRPVDSIDAASASTVQVRMSEPWSAFPAVLASAGASILAPSWWQDTTRPPVGTGPYEVATPATADGIVLVANEDFRIEGRPYLDELEFRFLPDEGERQTALESGTIDVLLTTEAATAAVLSDRFAVLTDAETQVDSITLNHGKAPFDDPRARRAVVLATDTPAIAEEMERGVARPASAPFGPDSPWLDGEVAAPQFDLEQARSLVAEIEADTGAPFAVRLTAVRSTDVERLASRISRMWQEAGIDVEVVLVDQDQLTGAISVGDTEAALFGFSSPGDPDGFYPFFHSDLSAPVGQLAVNLFRVEDADLDAALDAGRRATDPAERRAAYVSLFRTMNERATGVWLITEPFAMIVGPEVAGLLDENSSGLARPLPSTWAVDIGRAR